VIFYTCVGPVERLDRECTDDYGHKFGVGSQVIRGNYLELVPKQSRMYYLEENKTVIVLVGCVVSVVVDNFKTLLKTIKGKPCRCFIVTDNQHDIYMKLMGH